MSHLLVLGLGNPGAEYTHTRHNVGQLAVEELARRASTSLRAERSAHARVAQAVIDSARVTLAVPTTFMNESGQAAAPLVRRYLAEASVGDLVVIHDELDLPEGVIRLKVGGGTAGHNGLRSIGTHLHSLDFARIRIGIGRPPGQMSGADYVLRELRGESREAMMVSVALACDALTQILAEGFTQAMTTLNAR
jgi:PTH1 family peptidyl-tRNA hydrolase